jgi:hypothetical protein
MFQIFGCVSHCCMLHWQLCYLKGLLTRLNEFDILGAHPRLLWGDVLKVCLYHLHQSILLRGKPGYGLGAAFIL